MFRQNSKTHSSNLANCAAFGKLFSVNDSRDPNRESYYAQFPPPAIREPTPTPNNPPWNNWIALVVWIFSVFAIALFPTLLVLGYVASLGTGFAGNEQFGEFLRSDPSAVLLQILGIIPAHIVTLLLAWFVVTRARRYSFRSTLGWTSGGFKWWHYIAILFVFFGVAAVVGQFYPEQDNEMLRMLRSSRAAVFAVAFMATFSAPLVEEVVYRGILYSAFQRTFGIPAGVVIVTLLFALVHVPQYYPSISTIALLTFLSLILTLVRVRAGSLLPCIILHMIFNGLQSAVLLLEPYIGPVATQPEPATALFFLLK